MFLLPILPAEHTQFTVEQVASFRIEEVYNVITTPKCVYSYSTWYCTADTKEAKYKVECPKFTDLSCYYPGKE